MTRGRGRAVDVGIEAPWELFASSIPCRYTLSMTHRIATASSLYSSLPARLPIAQTKRGTASRPTHVPVVAIVLVLVSCVLSLPAAGRGPATPEERQQAVALARSLERDPLSRKAREARTWLTAWWATVPDLTATVCGALLGPFYQSDHPYASDLLSQMMYSNGAYVIEHQEVAASSVEALTAGLEGALRAYQAIVRAKPKLRHPFLDELCARKEPGALRAYVQQTLPRCQVDGAV